MDEKLPTRLTIISSESVRKSSKTRTIYTCLCSCGKTVKVDKYHFLHKKTRSCGCLRQELFRSRTTKHGLCTNRYFHLWRGMMDRCYNDKNKRFHRYGARGILVEEIWHEKSEFIKWCEKQNPEKGLTLEREDNNANYGPKNCKFATHHEQNRNLSSNVLIEYVGKIYVLQDFLEQFSSVTRNTFMYRLSLPEKFTPIEAARIPVNEFYLARKLKREGTFELETFLAGKTLKWKIQNQ